MQRCSHFQSRSVKCRWYIGSPTHDMQPCACPAFRLVCFQHEPQQVHELGGKENLRPSLGYIRMTDSICILYICRLTQFWYMQINSLYTDEKAVFKYSQSVQVSSACPKRRSFHLQHLLSPFVKSKGRIWPLDGMFNSCMSIPLEKDRLLGCLVVPAFAVLCSGWYIC